MIVRGGEDTKLPSLIEAWACVGTLNVTSHGGTGSLEEGGSSSSEEAIMSRPAVSELDKSDVV